MTRQRERFDYYYEILKVCKEGPLTSYAISCRLRRAHLKAVKIRIKDLVASGLLLTTTSSTKKIRRCPTYITTPKGASYLESYEKLLESLKC